MAKVPYSYTTWSSETKYAYDAQRNIYYQNGSGTFQRVGSLPSPSTDGRADYYTADVISYSDYYAFGAQMDGRYGGQHRYTFNGKETDLESDLQDYGMRIYNARLGKFLSVDPITASYPMLTPYQFASNSPIAGIDLDGLEFAPGYDASNINGEPRPAQQPSTSNATNNTGFVTAFSVTHQGVMVDIAGSNVSAVPQVTGTYSVSVTSSNAPNHQYSSSGVAPSHPIDNVLLTETVGAGAANIVGLGGQLRKYTFIGFGKPYLYNLATFEIGSFGVTGGSIGASVGVAKGIGYLSGMGYWDRPSDFYMRTSAYNLGIAIGEVNLSAEWTTSGPGYHHFDFGTGVGFEYKSGYKLLDKNPFSIDGGSSWVVTRERTPSRGDSILTAIQVRKITPDDSIAKRVLRLQ